jgi:ABC-type uncharacterized transport system permease subunit
MEMPFIVTFIILLIAATFRVATPLIYATLGELFSERAGILNLGIEGIMFFGSLVGFVFAEKSGSLWIGFLAALIGGVFSGLIMALLAVRLGTSQHVAGLGITLFLTAIALYTHRFLYGDVRVNPRIPPFQQLTPFGEIPIIGEITKQYLLTYVAFLLIPVVWWFLYRSSFGLKIRAVGENPEATDAAGVNVFAVRTISLAIGGALMSAGGAFLSLAQLGAFDPGIISGRGWVCIALIIFGNWHPVKVMWGALLFGGVYALQLRLQAYGAQLPYEVFMALPYLVTILALTLAGRNAMAPSALLKAYRRE